jgi:hypothetical protein
METIDNTTYTYKGNPYKIFTSTKVKIDGVWHNAIVYECLYDNQDGKYWVRLEEEFFNLFLPV